MRVVVITGSRDWTHREPLERVMRGAELAILGDASGADAEALGIAVVNDIIPVVYCASPHRAWVIRKMFGDLVGVHLVSDWGKDGRKGPNNAGFIRNGAMLHRAMAERDAGMHVECYAAPLPGSVGTHHCTRILKGQGFDVQRVYPPQAA